MTSDEEKLIEGCISGKRQAQSELYRKYSSIMFGVCLRYATNREEAEDVVQEGFIKVFQNIGTYRGQGSFAGWLRRIFVNTAINHYHAKVKQLVVIVENIEEYEDVDNNEIAGMFSHTAELEEISPDKVMKLVQELPDGYRMVMNLFVFEGYSHNEIAEMLGISENTSKSQLSKARKYLKRQLISLNKRIPTI
jgi:RNA polymerase sigma factor (sigma-70 family)